MRFDTPHVECLLASRWWRFKFTDFADMLFNDVPAFLDDLARRVERRRIEPFAPDPVDLASFWAA